MMPKVGDCGMKMNYIDLSFSPFTGFLLIEPGRAASSNFPLIGLTASPKYHPFIRLKWLSEHCIGLR